MYFLIFLTTLLFIANSNDLFAEDRLLSCDDVFVNSLTEDGLVELFGSSNVTSAEIYVGEGDYVNGTVVFQSVQEDRIEIIWKETGQIKQVRLTGPESNWETKSGITLGDNLKRIEELNRFPFRLAGFSWDNQGTVLSWGQGDLGRLESSCRVITRLAPSPRPVSSELQNF